MLSKDGGKKLSRLVKRKRESLEMTQRGFTEWLNTYIDLSVSDRKISYGAVQAWENEKADNRPDLNNFFLLAKVFGVGADDFVKFLNDPEHEDIAEYFSERHPEVRINPDMLIDLLRHSSRETREIVVIDFIRELLDKKSEPQVIEKAVEIEKVIEKPIDADGVKNFLKSVSKKQKLEFYQFLQTELLGA